MRWIYYGAAAAGLLATPLAADPPSAAATPKLVEQLVAHARTVTAEDHAYTRTVKTESTEGDKKEERVVVEKYDPTKPSDQRWSLITFNGQPPTAEQLQNYRKELPKRRQAYYGRAANYFKTPPAARVDERGRTVLTLASLPKETVMVSDADISANAQGEMVVETNGATPFIEEVRFRSTKPTRVKMVAKIERFETTLRYRQMPDGKPVPVELLSEMSGSLLTKVGRVRTRISYSDQRSIAK